MLRTAASPKCTLCTLTFWSKGFDGGTLCAILREHMRVDVACFFVNKSSFAL